MAFSFLLLRNFSRRSPKIYYRVLSLISQDFFFSNGGTTKPFSTSDIPQHSDPKPSLSARMSFVFDQIDAIEKERNNKDDALQRIRAWRETKKKKNDEDDESSKLGVSDSSEVKKKESLFNKEVEVVHPWPEWVELMERLVQQNYFDHRRQDEDKIVKELDIDISSLPEGGVDFTRDWIAVRTACLNFGRDRFDILRSLSRQDIQILVGHGCPSTDKKVVFSGKMLRKHVHLDEGDVCSSCNLRSSCEKAYLLSRKEDEARTIDVMRILLTYGFDPVNSAVENKSLLKLKTVKTVVRKLLHEIVKLSAVPIDPNLPPPIIKKPPPKVKQPPPPPRKRVGRDDIEMKKGDWLCPKCDFMNFAKNNVCLQCDAKRPKRQLLPGEWECPECNFLNYRRNMACFHCDHKRPPDEFMENQMQERQHGPRTRIERITDMPAGSNSWNFDFDDNESDGADVAAFEYADPPRVAEDFPIESQGQGGNVRGFEDDSIENSRISRSSGRGRHSDPDQRKSAVGFDDFDDEEDDDINSYVLETPNNKSMREPSRDFSEVEGYSESDDFDGPSSPSRSVRRKAFSDSDDDEEPSVYSDRKSSHAGDSRNGIRGGGRSGSFKGNMFGSDSEPEIDSGSDSNSRRGIGSNQGKRNKWSSNKKGFQRGGSSDSEDGLAFDSDSDNDDFRSGGKRFGGNKAGPVRRENNFRNDDRRNFYGNAGRGRSSHGSQRSNRESYEGGFGGRRMSERQNSFGNADRGRPSQGSHRNSRESYEDDFDGRRNSYGNANPGRSSRGSFGNDRESNGDGYSGRRGNDRHVSTRNSDRDRQGKGRGFQRNERSNGFNDRSEFTKDLSDDTPRRPRVIERTKPVYE